MLNTYCIYQTLLIVNLFFLMYFCILFLQIIWHVKDHSVLHTFRLWNLYVLIQYCRYINIMSSISHHCLCPIIDLIVQIIKVGGLYFTYIYISYSNSNSNSMFIKQIHYYKQYDMQLTAFYGSPAKEKKEV